MHIKKWIYYLLPLCVLPGCVHFSGLKKKSGGRVPASLGSPSYGGYQADSSARQLMERGRAAHHSGDYKIASQALSKLLTKYPYAGYMEEASCLLARALFYENQLEESEQVIQRLKDYNPNLHSECMGDAFLTLGRIYEKRGEIDSALSLYRKILAEFSAHGELVEETENQLLKISL